jgi:FKBP-type peptidyl-prolyl cis-trans isomerase
VGCKSLGVDIHVTDDVSTRRGVSSMSRRNALEVSMVGATAAAFEFFAQPARAEFQTSNEYMPSLEGKDYGKSKYVYPDFVQLPDGLQYKTMKEGSGPEMTSDKKAVIDWDGYTLGYYGRPFEARNKSKGGAFTGDDKEFVRFAADDPTIIPAFREAVLGMRAGEIRRVIVPGGSSLSYPQGRKWRTMGPQPSNFSGERALGFVLENEGMIDKTLLFDIELIRVAEK